MEVYGKTLVGLGPKDMLVAMRNTVSITVVRKENTTVHRRQITDSKQNRARGISPILRSSRKNRSN